MIENCKCITMDGVTVVIIAGCKTHDSTEPDEKQCACDACDDGCDNTAHGEFAPLCAACWEDCANDDNTTPLPTLTLHDDGSHSWLAVPLSEFPDALSFGTGFGFYDERQQIAYLEEDGELSAFYHAHRNEWVEVVKFYNGDAPCRSLPRINNAR